jgi:hypothetical protein
MQDLQHQLEEARRTFGRFLRNWRKSNGWVITTPQDWAKACPDVIPPGFRVSSGQWANLENAQVKQAQPSTFLQLALLNQALAREKRGVIRDELLRERVNAGQPIRKPDGTPWGPEDWFACYIGNLQGPEELWPREQEADLGEQSEQLRQALQGAEGMIGELTGKWNALSAQAETLNAQLARQQVILKYPQLISDPVVKLVQASQLAPEDLDPLFSLRAEGADLALLGFEPADPLLYGRILSGPDGEVRRIVEARDASPAELAAAARRLG